MADENDIGVRLNLDSSDFTAGMKDALSHLYDLGSADLSELVEKFKGLAVEVGILAGAVYATKKAFDFEMEAEAIKKVEASFKILAENAGLSGDAILAGMKKASGGMIDSTELMKLASEEIVRLGDRAGQLPELMELARKSSVVMGGTIEENFRNISMAVATGNQRLLKHIGLNIDVKKATEDYAKTLGVTADMLTEGGKQQAIMNAVLAAGSERFKGITGDAGGVTTAFQQINVAIKEIWETFLLVFDKLFGPVLKAAAKSVADFFQVLNLNIKSMFGEGKEKVDADAALIERRIADLKAKVAKEDDFKAKFGAHMNEGEYASAKQQLDSLLAKKAALEKPSAGPGLVGQRDLATEKKEDIDQGKLAEKRKADLDQQKADQQKFEQDMQKLTEERVKNDEANVHNMSEFDRNETEKRALMQIDYNNKVMAIENNSHLTKKQKAAELDALTAAHTSRMKSYDDDLAKRRQQNADKWDKSFSHSMATQSKIAHANFVDMDKTGRIAFNSIGKNAKKAFEDLGSGSKDAGEAMKGFMYGSIADIAEAKGEELLLSSIWPPNPLGLAAGGGLIALGAALRSQAGGSAGSAAGGGMPGTSGADLQGSSSTDLSGGGTAAGPVQPATQKTVTVQIQGHVFDSSETGTRIAQMIRDTADATDYVYKPIGTA